MTFEPSSGYMARALTLARSAAEQGEVPVGAVIVSREGIVVAESANRMRADGDPTAHAEMLAIREAVRRTGDPRLLDCDLYVTLEPCPMCAGAIALARLGRVYYGAADPKSGGVEHGPRVFNHPTCHHVPEVYPGLGETESRQLLSGFFAGLRKNQP